MSEWPFEVLVSVTSRLFFGRFWLFYLFFYFSDSENFSLNSTF